MGRPSPLIVKWKQQKAKRRRSGYWGRGLMKGSPKGPFLRDHDAMAYSKHASGTRHRDLCRLFAYTAGTEEKQKAWEAFFDPPTSAFDADGEPDPRLQLELRQEQVRLLNQDPYYRLLRFNVVFIQGTEETMFNLSLHFDGNEYFLVEKRVEYLRRSSIYTSRQRMLDLYHLGRIQWAARVSLTSIS